MRWLLLSLLVGCMPAIPLPDARKPAFRRAVFKAYPEGSSYSEGCHRACTGKGYQTCTRVTFSGPALIGREARERMGGVMCFYAR